MTKRIQQAADYTAEEPLAAGSSVVTRLRQTRADMIGTADEQHYWDCHDAAAEIERLHSELKRLQDLTNIDSRPIMVGGSDRVAQAFQKLQKLKQEVAQTATDELKNLTARLTQIDRALE